MDDLLRKLHARGLVLGADRPERTGLADLFTVSFNEPFDVPPAECIFVGDRLDRDIAPAKARGMATIRFRTGRWRKQRPRNEAETPDVEVTDVAELETAIIGLLSSRGQSPRDL